MAQYTETRYNNWIKKIEETQIDLQNADSLNVFDNMMEDFVVACINMLRDVREREMTKKQAIEELMYMQELLSNEIKFDDDFKNDFFEFAREGLKVVVNSTIMKLEGKKTAKSFDALIKEAIKKEREGDIEGASETISRMGLKILYGEKLPDDFELPEDGLVLNWLDGLDALNTVIMLSEIDSPTEILEDE